MLHQRGNAARTISSTFKGNQQFTKSLQHRKDSRNSVRLLPHPPMQRLTNKTMHGTHAAGETSEPDCLYVDEVESLIREFRNIKRYNCKMQSSNKGFPLPQQRNIDSICDRWIATLILVVQKRRKP